MKLSLNHFARGFNPNLIVGFFIRPLILPKGGVICAYQIPEQRKALSFNSWNPPSQASDHSKLTFLGVRGINGEAIHVNPSTNLL